MNHFFELVDPVWFAKLALRQRFTKKMRVGFGPVTTGENDLAERKWRIDPIINRLNSVSDRYSASCFFHPQQMKSFDVIVIIKKFNSYYFEEITKLRKLGKVFVYDIVDNPNRGAKNSIYFADCPQFSNQIDAFILSSPLHERDVQPFSKIYELIEHPVIHSYFKNNYNNDPPIKVLAHGYYEGLKQLRVLEPLLDELSDDLKMPIQMIYHSEQVLEETASVKYIKWTVENSFRLMTEVDIAVTAKDLSLPFQRNKPSTKVISFMAAGLPVICTPTEADKRVIQENVTGLYAYHPEDWKKHLKALCSNPKLREKMGSAARASVIDAYSIPRITEKYIQLLDRVTGASKSRAPTSHLPL